MEFFNGLALFFSVLIFLLVCRQCFFSVLLFFFFADPILGANKLVVNPHVRISLDCYTDMNEACPVTIILQIEPINIDIFIT